MKDKCGGVWLKGSALVKRSVYDLQMREPGRESSKMIERERERASSALSHTRPFCQC